jgi:predicted ester cyclase
LDQLLASDYTNHDAPAGTPAGIEGVRQIVKTFRAAFPDLKLTIEEQIAEGDKVCSLVTTRGTHRGAIFGIQPTDKPVVMSGLTMVRIVDGRLTDSWVKNDIAGLMNQLSSKAA